MGGREARHDGGRTPARHRCYVNHNRELRGISDVT